MPASTAVILLQMGGPDSIESVEPFLCNLFSDRDIIRMGPAFLQPVIARLIAGRRAPKSEAFYRQIGGRSPIRELTDAQASALENMLGEEFRCFVAMRYWRPSTLEALAAVKREGISKVIALSLYPHYSRATTGSSFNEMKRVLDHAGVEFCVKYIDRFFDHPLYIRALVERMEEGLTTFPGDEETHILFSAHSLPRSFIESGDPYLDQILETIRLVMERLGDVSYNLSFQSRAGPVKWLEPSTEEMLKKLAEARYNNLLVVPISFVSDHIETLYEIDIQYAEEARALGIENFLRIQSLNDSPLFIQCLADLVRKADKV